jgi:hypothetical protein
MDKNLFAMQFVFKTIKSIVGSIGFIVFFVVRGGGGIV